MWQHKGKPSSRREAWARRLQACHGLSLSARLVGVHLAQHGDRDGTRIYPSQERLAAELGLSTGTISRAVCELESCGWTLVVRWRPYRDRASGQWTRRRTNHYTLAYPPQQQDVSSGRRRRRRVSHRELAAQEAERRQKINAERVAKAEAALEQVTKKVFGAATVGAYLSQGPPKPPQAPSVIPKAQEPPAPPKASESALSALERAREAWRRHTLPESKAPPD